MAQDSTRVVRGHTRIVITGRKLREVTIVDVVPVEAPWFTTRVVHFCGRSADGPFTSSGKLFAWGQRLAISRRARVHFRREVRYPCLLITALQLYCVTST